MANLAYSVARSLVLHKCISEGCQSARRWLRDALEQHITLYDRQGDRCVALRETIRDAPRDGE